LPEKKEIHFRHYASLLAEIHRITFTLLFREVSLDASFPDRVGRCNYTFRFLVVAIFIFTLLLSIFPNVIIDFCFSIRTFLPSPLFTQFTSLRKIYRELFRDEISLQEGGEKEFSKLSPCDFCVFLSSTIMVH